MKNIFLIFIILFSANFSLSAEVNDVAGYLAKFSNAKKVDTKSISAGYRILEKAIGEEFINKKVTIDQAVQMTLLLLKHDPSNYATEIIYPFYKKNEAPFKASLKMQTAQEQKLFNETLKNYETELKEGNG